MSVLPIVHLGDPVLRRAAREVTLEELATADVQRLIDDMIDTKRHAHGAGIAAPQVGRSLRIAVIEVLEGPRYPYKPLAPLSVIVNPVLDPVGEEAYVNNEGCLSVPGLRGEVVRSVTVEVAALDRHGVPFTGHVAGLTAGTFQHEVDHLDGTVFVDRVADSRTFATWEQFDRFGRDAFVERITRFQEEVDARGTPP